MTRDRKILAMIRIFEKYGFIMDMPQGGKAPNVRRAENSRVLFHITESGNAFRVNANIACVGGDITPPDMLMASHEIMRAALAVMALESGGLSYDAA